MGLNLCCPITELSVSLAFLVCKTDIILQGDWTHRQVFNKPFMESPS